MTLRATGKKLIARVASAVTRSAIGFLVLTATVLFAKTNNADYASAVSASPLLSAVILAAQLSSVTLVPGTTSTWTDGTYTWAGNPGCVGSGYNYTLQSSSPAIDAGALIPGFHCPQPGSAIGQPTQADGSYCVEWYGAAPDIGACEYYVSAGTTAPAAPSGLTVQPATIQGVI